jgi:hypothetical protein
MLARLKGILFDPKREWPLIAAEPQTLQGLYAGWIMILAAIGPLALLAGTGVFGGTAAVRFALMMYVYALVGVAVMALIVDVIAPSFGGRRDYVSALKLTAYSSTAMWVAQATFVLPMAGALVVLAATIYSMYTLFLGAPALGKCAPGKAPVFAIVVLLCAIVLGYVIRAAVLPMGMGGGALGMRGGF